MLGMLQFNDVDTLRAYRAPQLGAIARGRTFLLGNTALRVQWDPEASEPHLQVVGHAVMRDGEPAIAPVPPWRPQWIWRLPPPAAGTGAPADYRAASAWLADKAVRSAMRHAVTQSHIYATEAEFARALCGQFRDVVLDHLAMGFPFTVGGNQGRIVWRGEHARVVPHRARHGAAPLAAVLDWLPPSVLPAPSQRERCARLEQICRGARRSCARRHRAEAPWTHPQGRRARRLAAIPGELTKTRRKTRKTATGSMSQRTQGKTKGAQDWKGSRHADCAGQHTHCRHRRVTADAGTSLPP